MSGSRTVRSRSCERQTEGFCLKIWTTTRCPDCRARLLRSSHACGLNRLDKQAESPESLRPQFRFFSSTWRCGVSGSQQRLWPSVFFEQMLASELRSAKLELSISRQQNLVRYCNELTRWNQKINLTGLTGVDLVRRLIVEPLWIGAALQMKGSMADIGSGNGSPGIPLSIGNDLDCAHLVEARTRRAAFLRHVTSLLKLKNIRVHNGLFEEVAASIGPVNWVTLQGVTPTKVLMQAIRLIASPTTRVVWITSGTDDLPKQESTSEIQVPFTNTRVQLLSLDLS